MVSIEEVDQAQKAWGDGIVKIAKAHRDGGDYIGLAENHIRTLYAYGQGRSCSNLRSHQLNNFVVPPRQHYHIFCRLKWCLP